MIINKHEGLPARSGLSKTENKYQNLKSKLANIFPTPGSNDRFSLVNNLTVSRTRV